MKCEREKVYNYLSDLIEEAREKEIIKNHLSNCETCQKYLIEFLLIKEEISKKEEPPAIEIFLASIKKRIRSKKKKVLIFSSLATVFSLFLIVVISLIFSQINKRKNQKDFTENNYEELFYSLSEKEAEIILKELTKELKEEEINLLEESLYLDKDYYDLIFSLEEKELKILIAEIKKGG